MRRLLLLLLATTTFSYGQKPAGAVASVDATPAPIDMVTQEQHLDMVTQEQHLWTTFAEGDFAAVRGLFTPDYIQVGDTIQALDTTLIFLRHCKVDSYELRDLQVRILTPNSAMTAYRVLSTFRCDATAPAGSGTKSFDNNSVTVWVRRSEKAKWLVQAHMEAPAKP